MTIGVLALQGDFDSHRAMLESVAQDSGDALRVVAVRDAKQLQECDALVIPGGESTVMSRLCDRYQMWEPLRARLNAGMGALGTCAGMILLSRNIEGGTRNFTQKTLGALDIDVARNAYGAQADSFETDIEFASLQNDESPSDALLTGALASTGEPDALDNRREVTSAENAPHEYSCAAQNDAADDVEDATETMETAAARRESRVSDSSGASVGSPVESVDRQVLHAVFIRAPRITRCGAGVEVLARHEGVPVVVRQGRVMAAAFHPEIAGDARLHALWLRSLRG